MTDITAIRAICEQYGLTQRALAERFGIPLRTVEDWCTGKRKPTDYVVQMIHTILENNNKTTKQNPIEYDKHYYKCPCCNEDLGVTDDDLYVYQEKPPNYCRNCGQALRWPNQISEQKDTE